MYPENCSQNDYALVGETFQSFCLGSDVYEGFLNFRVPDSFLSLKIQLQMPDFADSLIQVQLAYEKHDTINQIKNQLVQQVQECSETVAEPKVNLKKNSRKQKKNCVRWGRKDEKISIKRDQNLCKKYNSIALKVVSKLQRKGIANLFKCKIYRQDFLIIALLIAQHCGVLKEFDSLYRNQVLILREKIQKQKVKSRQIIRKNNDLVSGINKSLVSLQLFLDSEFEEARLKLFNLPKLRNKNFIEESKKLICEVQETIYQNTHESNI